MSKDAIRKAQEEFMLMQVRDAETVKKLQFEFTVFQHAQSIMHNSNVLLKSENKRLKEENACLRKNKPPKTQAQMKLT